MINRIKKRIYSKLRLKALQGNNVLCSYCQGSFITFFPGGVVTKRANAKCPQCGSLERHRLLWHFLQSKTNLFQDKLKVLHVAPEKLFFSRLSKLPNLEYTPCAKFGEGFTDEYPKGTVNKDITSLEEVDRTYDVILCSHVLEHIPDDIQAMKELHRVLRPDGWAILQVPLNPAFDVTYEDFSITDPKAREQAFGQYDHVRVYGKDYSTRLTKVGFKVRQQKTNELYSSQEIFRYGFDKGEDIFYCQK